MIGFIKLQRDIQGTWIHKDPVLLKAWIDILFNVNWEEKKVLIGSTQYTCGVGESLNSLDTWARIFGKGWDKSKVRRFFKRLESATLIDTQNERKTTRIRVLVSSSYEFERHAKRTQNERKTTPTKEDKNKEIKEEGIFDKRINQQLPFDSVTSNKTLNAIFADKNEAIQEVKQIFGQEVTKNDVSIAIQSFCTVAITNYDAYRGIRSVEKLKNKFIGWIPKSVKYQATQKPLSQKTENLNLEKYILQYYPKELRHWKKNGEFERLEKLLATDKFKLTNMSKNKKNASYTALFLFECRHMRLGNRLNGSTPQRKLESLDRWEKGLNDYNRNKGDLRQLLKQKV
jgi:hypothetical protein